MAERHGSGGGGWQGGKCRTETHYVWTGTGGGGSPLIWYDALRLARHDADELHERGWSSYDPRYMDDFRRWQDDGGQQP